MLTIPTKWEDTVVRRYCYNCFASKTNLLQCQRCKIAMFCNRDCQKAAHKYHRLCCVENEELQTLHAQVNQLSCYDAVCTLETLMRQGAPTPIFAILLNRIRSTLIHNGVLASKCNTASHDPSFSSRDQQGSLDEISYELGADGDDIGFSLHSMSRVSFLSSERSHALLRGLWAAPGAPELLLNKMLY